MNALKLSCLLAPCLTLMAYLSLMATADVRANTQYYRLMLRDDPATTVVIGWTQSGTEDAVVYYGQSDAGTNWKAYPHQQKPDRAVTYHGMEHRFVRLTGLKPNTRYYFLIRDPESVSRRFWFRTLPDQPDTRLSFVAGGDSRNNRIPRRNANLLVARLRPHAVLFGGDMTLSDAPGEWRDWLEDWQLTIAEDGRMTPLVATRGNHEMRNETLTHLLDVPSEQVYYAVSFGGNLLRTYTLNTEISIAGAQTDWLAEDLAQHHEQVTWLMAQYHKPMRPHALGKPNKDMAYAHWAPLFHQFGMDLVVECDAHVCKSTWPIKPDPDGEDGFRRDDLTGTVYIGEGCWGAPLRQIERTFLGITFESRNRSWTRSSGSFNQVKWIFVDPKQIEVRTLLTDNAEQVAEVSDENRFSAPANLNIWHPETGAVIRITHKPGSRPASPPAR